MEFVLAAIVIAGIVAMIVMAPLRRAEQRARGEEDRRAALEAAKEAKYREIRDVELDYRMGKLSEADWREADAELRTQAMRILRDLDALGDATDAGDAADSDAAGATDPEAGAADSDASPAGDRDAGAAADPRANGADRDAGAAADPRANGADRDAGAAADPRANGADRG